MSVANLITTADSAFESGVADWLPGGFTSIATSTSQAHSPTHSLALTCLANGPSSAVLNVLFPILPGVIINPSAWFFVPGGQTAQFTLTWLASDKATILSTSVLNSPTALIANTWTQAAFNGTQAPASAFWVQLQVTSNNTNAGNISFIDDVALGWGNYATNMCPNPSFEIDLTGWSGTRGDETLTLVDTVNFTGQLFSSQLDSNIAFTQTLFGTNSMQVITPGSQQNEGVFGPSTFMPATTTGSMSCNIYGQSGTLAVQAVDQITGAILATQLVTLSGGLNWTNAVVSNLTFVAGHTYYLQIITDGFAQDLTFYVDGVMYQPEPQVPVYVDGDQSQCLWTGAVEESASFQPYQFGIQARCTFLIGGVANTLATGPGVVALTTPVTGTPDLEFFVTFGPAPPVGVQLIVLSPPAAMTDFGIWQGGLAQELGKDLDPAMAYSTWNNQDVMSGQVGYHQPYMAVCPPLDLVNSTGGYTWKRAAYMALGWQWVSVTNGTSQILTDVQTELLPINAFSAITPRAYEPARQLQTIVKPDRLNYVTNPSFETSTANWSQIGSGQTLGIAGSTLVIPGQAFSPGGNSMSVNVTTASGTGVQITINFLIPGRTYMASMWLQPDGTSMGDVLATCGTGSGTITASQGTGYNAGTYGAGPYGGTALNTVPLTTAWQQLFFSFQATADSHVLQVSPVNVASPVFAYKWFIDAVLVEDGDILNDYFDGNFGVDALWLDGGTANLCQSFYYNQLQFARHVITDSLAANTPLGITYAQPLYATMPTQ